jgi:hypothetical protein
MIFQPIFLPAMIVRSLVCFVLILNLILQTRPLLRSVSSCYLCFLFPLFFLPCIPDRSLIAWVVLGSWSSFLLFYFIVSSLALLNSSLALFYHRFLDPIHCLFCSDPPCSWRFPCLVHDLHIHSCLYCSSSLFFISERALFSRFYSDFSSNFVSSLSENF